MEDNNRIETVDNSGWWAYVKYKNGDKEYRPINKIKERLLNLKKKMPINPQHFEDFIKTKYYSVTTSQGMKGDTETKWYAVIGALAESKDALDAKVQKKRINWPVMEVNEESEPATSSTEIEITVSPKVSKAAEKRADKRIRQFAKRSSKDITQRELLEQHALNLDNSDVEIRGIDDVSIENETLKAKLARLESKLEAAERKARKAEAEVVSNRSDETSVLAKIDEKLRDLKESQSAEIAKLQEKIDHFAKTPGVPSSSGVSSGVVSYNDEEKVCIGPDLMCTKSSLEVMKNPNVSHPAWGLALLRGCFGEEGHLMRWRKGAPETIPYTLRQKESIKELYKGWLTSVTMDDFKNTGCRVPRYSPAGIAKLMSELPSFLGDKAYRLYDQVEPGRPKKQKKKKEETLPPNPTGETVTSAAPVPPMEGEDGPTPEEEPRPSTAAPVHAQPKKRKYTRKGDSASLLFHTTAERQSHFQFQEIPEQPQVQQEPLRAEQNGVQALLEKCAEEDRSLMDISNAVMTHL